MQSAHACEVFTVAALILIVAAGGFTAVLAAEAGAIHGVQFELSSQGKAELYVFSTHSVVGVEPKKSLKVFAADNHGGTGGCWNRPGISQNCMVLRTN